MALGVPRGPLPEMVRLHLEVQVIVALSELCPCDIFFAGAGGVINRAPRSTGDRYCKCYCGHRAGCNLISGLINSATSYHIIITGGGNGYHPPTNTISWNPNRAMGGRNSRGDNRRPTSIGLGHELVHAVHDDSGTLGATRAVEEDNTVRAENQLRDEIGETDRTHYGRRRVRNRNQPNIDGSDRMNCGCGIFRRIWRAIKFFFIDLFTSNEKEEGR